MAATGPATEQQIAGFLAKYIPEIVAYATDARKRMRKDVPGVEFVYDNYNALVFGYGPSERASEAVLAAIAAAAPPFPGSGAPRTMVKSISAKQRPRRTSAAKSRRAKQ